MVIVFGLIFFNASPFALAETAQEREARLNAELKKVEEEIAAQKANLKVKQKETASIKRDVDILTGKINTAQLNIQSKKIQISQLGSDISKKVVTINGLNDKLDQEKISLAELLRQTRELDDYNFAEIALTNDSLSNLLVDFQRFHSVGESIGTTLEVVREVKSETETNKKLLENRRDSETNAKKAIEEEKSRVERLNDEKTMYLNASKAKENAYKAVIAQKEAQRAAIRSALFTLRNAKSITFGEALDQAKIIAAKINIRPAFLLAILTQESNLGKNIGTCNRPGDPPSKGWRVVMKPERDQAPFLRITKALGLDPNTQPVSCPYMGGYGGAMGPAQFIPSTWEMYAGKVTRITGNSPANPWNTQDAFAASATYLSELGAIAGNYSAERRAALKYYAGGNWANPKNAFYGDQVMAIASKYQQQIEVLQND